MDPGAGDLPPTHPTPQAPAPSGRPPAHLEADAPRPGVGAHRQDGAAQVIHLPEGGGAGWAWE